MATFELQSAYKPDGDSACAGFDDDACLWKDERLGFAESLKDAWRAPFLKLWRPAAGPTAVLFNPDALAVSEGVRQELASFPGLEFLPVHIEGCGVFHVLHVTAAIELPRGSDARIDAATSGNIVEIRAFPSTFVPTFPFFRVLHPPGSAARRKGPRHTLSVYLDDHAARVVESSSGGCLVAVPVPITA